jgi:hypothetical protein
VRRLRHLLNVLDRHPEHRLRVSTLLRDTLAGWTPRACWPISASRRGTASSASWPTGCA